ncbi:MAG: hypothetical protein ACKPHU_34275 [Planctomycetaceae bacterium]
MELVFLCFLRFRQRFFDRGDGVSVSVGVAADCRCVLSLTGLGFLLLQRELCDV